MPPLLLLNGTASLQRQIYVGLREAMLRGELLPGSRLPGARQFARELGVSRNTVGLALGQLQAEGYLKMHERTGTFVSPVLPDARVQTSPISVGVRSISVAAPAPSANGRRLAALGLTSSVEIRALRPFRAGAPALRDFPVAPWVRVLASAWRATPPDELGYAAPSGDPELQAELAAYVAEKRAVRCLPEQVIVTHGSQQALDLIARLTLDAGDTVWMENPGYRGARRVWSSAGASVCSVPVDMEGLDVTIGERLAPNARLVYVTPSHQYPIGVTMSIARRLALLDWARRANAWVVEDDYDSEFRYASRPLPSLQSLDRDGRVLYVGTFSKTLCPAIRLGFLVVPPSLVDVVSAVRSTMDRHPPTVEQRALAAFIRQGELARHIRRMRLLYEERRNALCEAIHATGLDERLEIGPAEAGLHLVAWLRDERASDVKVAEAALARDVEVTPLSYSSETLLERGGIVLGYGAYTPQEIRTAVVALGKAFRSLGR